jgi:hypothetical protein
MADLSDVEVALVSTVTEAIYPSGSALPSVLGIPCRIYRGWPLATALTSDLKNGTINITIFPDAEAGRLTTRYNNSLRGSSAAVTLTADIAGNTVSFDGQASSGQIAGLLIDGQTYVYCTQSGDTPATVAANLAESARAQLIVTLSGATLTVPTAGKLSARVVASASFQQEVRRQERSFHIACWCPSPLSRDQIAIAIDQAFAGMTFVTFTDGTSGRILYKGTTVMDRSEDVLLYRRDLIFEVEYPTIVANRLPEMLFGDLTLNSPTLVA